MTIKLKQRKTGKAIKYRKTETIIRKLAKKGYSANKIQIGFGMVERLKESLEESGVVIEGYSESSGVDDGLGGIGLGRDSVAKCGAP